MMKPKIAITAQMCSGNSEKCYKTRRQAKIDAVGIVLSKGEGSLFLLEKESSVFAKSIPHQSAGRAPYYAFIGVPTTSSIFAPW